jgi:hypothetical protein
VFVLANYSPDWQIVGVHTVVKHGKYTLYTNDDRIQVQPSATQPGTQEVVIPKSAPLGTYTYSFTLKVSGYADQTLHTTFTVVK